MDKKVLVLVLFAAVVILVLVNVMGRESISELVVEEEVPEDTGIVVEELLLNGEEGSLTLTTDDPSVITATVRNDSDEEREVELSVRMGGRLFDERHDWTYTIAPGETLEIEEVREDHRTWYPGEFTVELEGNVIDVVVE